MSANDQADGFYEEEPATLLAPWYCTSESDGSVCRCGATVKKRKPMGPLYRESQRELGELFTMPYGMRLSRGFALLSGNKHDL